MAAAHQTVLFLALWPDDATLAAVQEHVAQWQWAPRATVYAPPDWHITLHYLGLAVDPRPYQPHLTLARHAQGSTPPASFHPLRLPYRDVALVESTGHPKSRYRVRRRLPLA
jgi:2'-5' RNA ligase